MRDHYVGDISDLLKFSLLRQLVANDRSLGIAWYYHPDVDNAKDGAHNTWQGDPRWRELDRHVRDSLCGLPERSVAALEAALAWPAGVRYHRDPVNADRVAWANAKRQHLQNSDLVFLDPDNGLGNTDKHASLEEVRMLLSLGKAVAFITFPKRQNHAIQVKELHHNLLKLGDARNVITLRTSVSMPNRSNSGYVPTFRWFTLINHDAELRARLEAFAIKLEQCQRVRVRVEH